jgi:hypothetical protein
MHAAKDQVDRLVLAFVGPVYVRAGDTVIKQGDSVDTHDPGLFLLASGSVDVFVAKGMDKPPGHHVFKFKKPGQTFGQVALLYDCPRTATVMACEDSELWHLNRTSFKLCSDSSHLERMVAEHSHTVAKYGLEAKSVTSHFGVFDVNLTDEGQEFRHNLECYYNMCKGSTRIMATLSCFGHWNDHKKINGAGKVIPAVPKTNTDQVRIFFFDDNLEWEGKEKSPGICNLRNVVTGEFVEFAEGTNGFRQETTGRFTVIHHSSDYNVVLVKANILDAMEFPGYFTDIVQKFSQPGEKSILFMDVNSTILSADSVSDKDMTIILLGTLVEFMTLEPRETFTVEWEDRKPVKVTKKMSVKQLAKKICEGDKTYYDQFYTLANCLKLLDIVIERATVTWSRNDVPFSLQNFQEAFEHYNLALSGSTNDIGLAHSWFECYQAAMSDGQAVVMNSFGMDVRPTLVKTVVDEREVLYVAVSMTKWNPKDLAGFEKIYELSEFGREKKRVNAIMNDRNACANEPTSPEPLTPATRRIKGEPLSPMAPVWN